MRTMNERQGYCVVAAVRLTEKKGRGQPLKKSQTGNNLAEASVEPPAGAAI